MQRHFFRLQCGKRGQSTCTHARDHYSNTVRTWVEWNIAEPEEGSYHLENLDLLLRLAHEVGLQVIVQVYVDSAPEWVGKKYPDGRYAAQDGLPISSQAAPGFCFDNRGVRKAILDFFQEVARHAARSPNFYGWDLWSEPAALNWARIGYKSEVARLHPLSVTTASQSGTLRHAFLSNFQERRVRSTL